MDSAELMGRSWPRRQRQHQQGKGINYRMNPDNIGMLTAAGIQAVSLANNYVLDWGYSGLSETITSVDLAGTRHAGAGKDGAAAASPAVLDLGQTGGCLSFPWPMVRAAYRPPGLRKGTGRA